MQKVIALPEFFTVDGAVQETKVQVATDGFDAAFITYLAQYGWNVIMQRCTSGIKKEEDPEGFAEERAETFAQLERGEQPADSGKGGPRQSPQTKGWITWLNTIGHKEDKKPINGQNLRRAQERLCRQDLLKKAGPVGSPARKDVEANIGQHLKERFQAWKTWMETENADLAEEIEAEIRRRAKQAKKPLEADLANAKF